MIYKLFVCSPNISLNVVLSYDALQPLIASTGLPVQYTKGSLPFSTRVVTLFFDKSRSSSSSYIKSHKRSKNLPSLGRALTIVAMATFLAVFCGRNTQEKLPFLLSKASEFCSIVLPRMLCKQNQIFHLFILIYSDLPMIRYVLKIKELHMT